MCKCVLLCDMYYMYAGVYGWLTEHREAEKCNWSLKPNHAHSALLIKIEYGLTENMAGMTLQMNIK